MVPAPATEEREGEGAVLEYRSRPTAAVAKRSIVDVVFGVVVLLGGVVCALGVILMVGVAIISRVQGRNEFGLVPASISGAVFAVIAYLLIGLGVGMVRGDPTSRPSEPE